MSKKVTKKDLGKQMGLAVAAILLVAVPFWYGNRAENPVAPLLFPPSPTPTPDPRTAMGQQADVGLLKLRVLEAWRIARPTEAQDLGIITVEFAGTSDCSDPEMGTACTFDRTRLSLATVDGRQQPVSAPPTKYIVGMKIIQLTSMRDLSSLTSEAGQVYFLLDKDSQDFTLSYVPVGETEEVRLKVLPKKYANEDVQRNLTSTPQPKVTVIGTLAPTR